jgi:hypothetical protein
LQKSLLRPVGQLGANRIEQLNCIFIALLLQRLDDFWKQHRQ